MYKFCIGLFRLWVIKAFGLASILSKDLLLIVGAPFLSAPGGAARRSDRDHVSIQRAPDADFGACLLPALATARVAATVVPRC